MYLSGFGWWDLGGEGGDVGTCEWMTQVTRVTAGYDYAAEAICTDRVKGGA